MPNDGPPSAISSRNTGIAEPGANAVVLKLEEPTRRTRTLAGLKAMYFWEGVAVFEAVLDAVAV